MSIFHDFDDIPHSHYTTILADPAWAFVTRSAKGKGRSPEQHYDCMSIDEIKALPVARLACSNAVLLLWVPDPHLKLGLEVMEAWGFTYKTVGFTWVKRNKRAKPLVAHGGTTWEMEYWSDDQFFTGMGYWTRANAEMCLLGTRGHPPRLNKDVRRLIVSRRREHSRKPNEAYGRIERLVPGPFIELFARTTRPGWDSWGNEVTRFDAKENLETHNTATALCV